MDYPILLNMFFYDDKQYRSKCVISSGSALYVDVSLNPSCYSDSYMRTLANSEDPGEMPHNAAFHQGLHCLLRQKKRSVKQMQFYLEIITCGPSNYTMGHVSNQKEESIST